MTRRAARAKRGSESAFTSTSGPIPSGSPMVMPMVGREGGGERDMGEWYACSSGRFAALESGSLRDPWTAGCYAALGKRRLRRLGKRSLCDLGDMLLAPLTV